MSDREIQSVSPSSLATEEEMSCTGDPNACLVSHMFGAGYTLSTASAYVVATSFDAQMMGPAERSTDQPLIEWDWNIFPKSTGRQVINVGIDLQWTPTGKSGGTSILRQLWESPIAIEVDKPFFDAGQLTVSAAASGVFGTAFTGFSLQWMLEQRRQKREEKKKKIKYCQYCRAENPEDFEFCTNRYNHFCSVNTISRANGRSAIFCWKYGRSAGNSCIRLLSGKWKIGRSPEWYEMKEVKIMPFCIDCGNQEPEGVAFCSSCGQSMTTASTITSRNNTLQQDVVAQTRKDPIAETVASVPAPLPIEVPPTTTYLPADGRVAAQAPLSAAQGKSPLPLKEIMLHLPARVCFPRRWSIVLALIVLMGGGGIWAILYLIAPSALAPSAYDQFVMRMGYNSASMISIAASIPTSLSSLQQQLRR